MANIRSYFNKLGGSLGTQGMLDFMFERKSVFSVKVTPDMDLESLELELIDYGVEELLSEDDETIVIYANFQSFGSVQKYLEDNHFEIKSFRFERVPNDTKELTPEERAEVEKLIERIEEDDDVTNVFHNMKEVEE